MRWAPAIDGHDDAESGFALIAVLWFLVLVSAVVASFAVAARTDFLIASNAHQKLRLDIIAENIATLVTVRISAAESLSEGADFHLNGLPHTCTSGRYTVELRIQDQSGLVDLNVSDERLLTIGLQALGFAEGEDVTIAKAIIAFRSYQPQAQSQTDADIVGGKKGGPFETVVELSDIGPLGGLEPAELYRVFTIQSRQPFVSLNRSPETLAQRLQSQDAGVQRNADAGTPRALAIEVSVVDRSTAIRGYAGYLIEQSQSAGRPFRRAEPLFEPVFSATPPGQNRDCPPVLRDALIQLTENHA